MIQSSAPLHGQMRLSTFVGFLLVGTLMFPEAGCHRGPAAVRPPKIDPGRSANAAIEQYDQDADGFLSESELAGCPGIVGELEAYDQDQDQRVSAAEIEARIQQWRESGTGLRPFSCAVIFDNRPLVGAEVRLAPESFLGDALKQASGTTAADGTATIAIAAEDLPEDLSDLLGVQMGIYKVQITHPDVELPAGYNTETTLGIEINQRTSQAPVVFRLTGS